jgi:chromosome segregation ATPase
MLSPPSIEPIISSEYDTILEEVQDLNLQLHRKSSVNVDLTKEKEGLVSELEKCREELNISRIKIAKSKEALAGQLKSTCLREKNLSTLESTWRCSMERERKEIEALRSDLIRVESSGSEEKLETLQYEVSALWHFFSFTTTFTMILMSITVVIIGYSNA